MQLKIKTTSRGPQESDDTEIVPPQPPVCQLCGSASERGIP